MPDGGRGAGGDGREPFGQFGAGGAVDDDPVAVGRAGGVGGAGEVADPLGGGAGELVGVGTGQGAQGLLVGGAGLEEVAVLGEGATVRGPGWFLDDHVGVDAAHAEGAEGGAAGALAARPGPGAVGEVERGALEADVVVGAGHVQRGGDAFALHRQEDLDEAREAGRRFEVSDVGLQ